MMRSRLPWRVPFSPAFLHSALIVVLLFLTACDRLSLPGARHPGESTQSPSAPARPSDTPMAKPGVTILTASPLPIATPDLSGTLVHFWHPWSGELGRSLTALVEQFNLNNPWGVLVAARQYPGYDALEAELEQAAQATDRPQVAILFPHQALALDEASQLVDLRSYVNNPQWGFTSLELESFYPLFAEQGAVDGRRLGVPVFYSAPLLYYNQTWAQELGFDRPPANPDEFLQQACTAASANQRDDDRDNDATGGWIVTTDYAALLSWLYAFGGDALKSPEPGLSQSVYQFNTPQNEEALRFLRAAFENGCAWLPASQVPEDEFAQRMGLFYIGSVMDIPHQQEAFQVLGSRDRWTVLPFPSAASRPVLEVYGPLYTLLTGSQEQQLAAWLFLRWLSSPDNQARLVQASGALPVSEAALESLEAYAGRYPQWVAALDFLRYARVEPSYRSWGQVRWAMQDAATQLFRPYFTIDQVPVLLSYLDSFAAELHLGPDLESVFATVTNTPKPSSTPTRTPTPSPSPTRTRTPAPPSPSPSP